MTTVATDGKSMAADSYCGGELFHTEVRKLYRAKDGAILGCAGQAFDIDAFASWYESGGELSVTKDFEGLILKVDGTIVCIDEKARTFIHQSPAAIGSGCSVAYGAMDAGASPQRAVEIATIRNAFTGGPICVEKIEK